MRKSEWALVAVLVFTGLSCLLMSAGGMAWEAEGGWRGLTARAFLTATPYLMLLACVLVLGIAGSYLFALFRPAPRTEQCPACGRTVEPAWRRCPYCESVLEQKEASRP